MNAEKFEEISTKINTLRLALMKDYGFSKEDALEAAWNFFLPNVSFADFLADMIAETATKTKE